VFASVSRALEAGTAGPSCFVTRNPKDFDDPAIKDVLSRYRCTLKTNFESGLAFIEKQTNVGGVG